MLRFTDNKGNEGRQIKEDFHGSQLGGSGVDCRLFLSRSNDLTNTAGCLTFNANWFQWINFQMKSSFMDGRQRVHDVRTRLGNR